MFTRERHRRGTIYFGPYANAKKVRETLDVLNRVFRFRPCEGPRPGRHSGIPCLDFHIDRCFAPCIGAISKDGYAEVIDGVVGFLSGDTKTIQAELTERMREAAADERFEEAARYRNRLFSIRHLADRQAADRRDVGSVDVIGLASNGNRAAVQVFPLRDGKMIDRYGFHLENVAGEDDQSILEAFVLEYYGGSPSVPPEVLIPPGIDDVAALAEFLGERRGARVVVRTPLRGEKGRLVELAAENAQLAWRRTPRCVRRPARSGSQCSMSSRRRWKLQCRPALLMVCFDISHTQGSETVASASLAFFTNGAPSTGPKYRRLKIKGKDWERRLPLDERGGGPLLLVAGGRWRRARAAPTRPGGDRRREGAARCGAEGAWRSWTSRNSRSG